MAPAVSVPFRGAPPERGGCGATRATYREQGRRDRDTRMVVPAMPGIAEVTLLELIAMDWGALVSANSATMAPDPQSPS